MYVICPFYVQLKNRHWIAWQIESFSSVCKNISFFISKDMLLSIGSNFYIFLIMVKKENPYSCLLDLCIFFLFPWELSFQNPCPFLYWVISDL